MRLKRPWPFQKWKPLVGDGRIVVHHSYWLAVIGKCKCINCLTRKHMRKHEPTA